VLATVMGEGPRISSGFGATDLGSREGYRPATVQQVDAERNEQSGASRGAAVDDWVAAAHPWRHPMPSSTRRVGIIRMALSSFPRVLDATWGARPGPGVNRTELPR
jgi:hypothetical protein